MNRTILTVLTLLSASTALTLSGCDDSSDNSLTNGLPAGASRSPAPGNDTGGAYSHSEAPGSP